MNRKEFTLENRIDESQYTNAISGCHPSIIDLVWTKNITVEEIEVVDNYCFGNSFHRPVVFSIQMQKNMYKG